MRTSTRRGERGSATVYAVFGCFAMLLTCVVALQVATLVRLQHKAAAAADLAALAASRAAVGGRDGCAVARRIVTANGAELVSCTMAADVATLEVGRTSRPMYGRTWTVRRRARAGPADYVESQTAREKAKESTRR